MEKKDNETSVQDRIVILNDENKGYTVTDAEETDTEEIQADIFITLSELTELVEKLADSDQETLEIMVKDEEIILPGWYIIKSKKLVYNYKLLDRNNLTYLGITDDMQGVLVFNIIDQKKHILRGKLTVQDVHELADKTNAVINFMKQIIPHEQYSIYDDMSVDIIGDQDFKLTGNKFTDNKLPFKINSVAGNFIVNETNIVSMENFPETIGGYLELKNNSDLIDLYGCPYEVTGYFTCVNNAKGPFTVQEISSVCNVVSNDIRVSGDGNSPYIYNEQIFKALILLGIKENYVIEQDLTISYTGNLTLNGSFINGLPVSFRIVKGDFKISDCSLKTLTGCPHEVTGNFDCSGNMLENLFNGPQIVGKNYNASNNIIVSLGGVNKIGGNFDCVYNKIRTPEGIENLLLDGKLFLVDENEEYDDPSTLVTAADILNINNNLKEEQIVSISQERLLYIKNHIRHNLNLYNIDQDYIINKDGKIDIMNSVNLSYQDLRYGIKVKFGSIKGDFNIECCNLSSFMNAPYAVEGNLLARCNRLTDLTYAPIQVDGNFDVSWNDIVNFNGDLEYVGGTFNCVNNNIQSLSGLDSLVVNGDFIFFNEGDLTGNNVKYTEDNIREKYQINGAISTYSQVQQNIYILTIKSILNELRINEENCTINEDFSIDLEGDLVLPYNITELPIRFHMITGNFDATSCYLHTLKNCPVIINGNCSINSINLKNLDDAPKIVNGYFSILPFQSSRYNKFTQHEIAAVCEVKSKDIRIKLPSNDENIYLMSKADINEFITKLKLKINTHIEEDQYAIYGRETEKNNEVVMFYKNVTAIITSSRSSLPSIYSDKLIQDYKQSISDILKKFNISPDKCLIHNDGTVDINSDVDISNSNLLEMPLKFGNILGSFNASNNYFRDLKNGPKSVKYNYLINDILTLHSLEGLPASVGGYFSHVTNRKNSLNKNFTVQDILGLCDVISRDIRLKDRNIVNIYDMKAQKEYEETIRSAYRLNGLDNKITVLLDGKINIDGSVTIPLRYRSSNNIDNSNSLITSLNINIDTVFGNFQLGQNDLGTALNSLKGGPRKVMGNYIVPLPARITSLEGAPKKVYGYFCWNKNVRFPYLKTMDILSICDVVSRDIRLDAIERPQIYTLEEHQKYVKMTQIKLIDVFGDDNDYVIDERGNIDIHGDIYINNVNNMDFTEFPVKINMLLGSLIVEKAAINTLKNFPNIVGEDFNINDIPVSSLPDALENIPKEVYGYFSAKAKDAEHIFNKIRMMDINITERCKIRSERIEIGTFDSKEYRNVLKELQRLLLINLNKEALIQVIPI